MSSMEDRFLEVFGPGRGSPEPGEAHEVLSPQSVEYELKVSRSEEGWVAAARIRLAYGDWEEWSTDPREQERAATGEAIAWLVGRGRKLRGT